MKFDVYTPTVAETNMSEYITTFCQTVARF